MVFLFYLCLSHIHAVLQQVGFLIIKDYSEDMLSLILQK